MEKYSPKPEEQKKATDTMTDLQESMSGRRGLQKEMLEEMGVSGYLFVRGDSYAMDTSDIKNGSRIFLEGNLNRHDLKIEYIYENDKATYKGTLGGMDLEPEDAKKFFKKYYGLATVKESEEGMTEHANKEIKEHDFAEALKELL